VFQAAEHASAVVDIRSRGVTRPVSLPWCGRVGAIVVSAGGESKATGPQPAGVPGPACVVRRPRPHGTDRPGNKAGVVLPCAGGVMVSLSRTAW